MKKRTELGDGGNVVRLAGDGQSATSSDGRRRRRASPSKGGRPRAGEILTPEDLKIVETYIEVGSKAEVARRMRISPGKVSSHLRFPLVRRELAQRMEELRELYRARLHHLGGKAFETLERLLDDESPAVRLKAATFIVDRLLALPDLESTLHVPGMDERLAELTTNLQGEDGDD